MPSISSVIINALSPRSQRNSGATSPLSPADDIYTLRGLILLGLILTIFVHTTGRLSSLPLIPSLDIETSALHITVFAATSVGELKRKKKARGKKYRHKISLVRALFFLQAPLAVFGSIKPLKCAHDWRWHVRPQMPVP
ncbi:hypothetical protein GGI43DRAFT_253253 [Trichoderma evansii]